MIRSLVMVRLLVGAAALIVGGAAAHAAGPLAWPQFRGPGGSGVADDEKPPIEIGPDKNVKWSVAVPPGLSSPIVVGDLLVLTAFENDKLFTIAYRRSDGGEAWRAHAPAEKLEKFHPEEGSPAASTPATDGERIVSYFGSCGLFGYDKNGRELWSYKLPPAETMADFGTGASPIIAGGTVVLLRDETKEPLILALDAATGEERWRKARESKTGFCTPAAWDTPGGMQIVAPGMKEMIGYDLATGDKRWFVSGMPAACCASPVVADGQLLFAGWSPGDPSEAGESDFKMPTFAEFLGQSGDDDKDGVVSKAEAADTGFASFFDGNDPNKDGRIVREEWDAMLEFVSASRNSAFSLRPGGSGDVTESHVAWKATRGLPYVSTAIAYRGQYVMVKDGGIVTAYDVATGKELYQKRAVAGGSYYASPVAANGYIYFTALGDGAVTVIESGSPTAKVAAKNPPLGERVAATPAIADDTLYVRTGTKLYAFGEK
jgi:outer membrane protein assembly factor BamB